ncbi:DUF4339 domain-containing protein [Cerasicoccus arenae]|uniref:GYF domain-containing protein n=1 Tax=Cerasicoccus arenae TaxID=424488 RepID=A0A8J3DJH5_9BACT|nr:DUF4339 domain-containing protein [Cerasicoccus arenae]MBK1858486.1 DUF4339 domain-containing protein [Cerasicoccus arenae]GHC10352.1 hypothetical protein GCM10007047_29610 [Cerasicoccus arenae]
MSSERLYFFDSEAKQARGPYLLDQLKEFSETGVISRNTLVAPPDNSEWIAISDWPELDSFLFPPSTIHLRTERYQAEAEAPAALATDAYEVLAINRSHEDPDKLVITDEDMRPRMTRRTRDYLWGIFGGNFLIIAGNGLYGLLFGVNPVILLFSLALVAMWTAGFTWITYGIMGRW